VTLSMTNERGSHKIRIRRKRRSIMRLFNCPNKLTIFRLSKNGLREAKIKSVLTTLFHVF